MYCNQHLLKKCPLKYITGKNKVKNREAIVKNNKTDRKSRYTRMVLRESLFELMEEMPAAKITVKDICTTADINRTTFYAHYEDKYDLIKSIEDETILWAKELIEKLMATTDERGRITVLEEILAYFADNSKRLSVLMSEQGDIRFQKQLLMLIYEKCGIVPESIKNGDIEKNELYYIFVINGSIGLLRSWLENPSGKSAKHIAEVINDISKIII